MTFIPARSTALCHLWHQMSDTQVLRTQDGNTVVVCTCAAVSSMVTGVLVGLLALGERMPASAAARAVVLASWLAIALGVSGLANGPGACSRTHKIQVLRILIANAVAWLAVGSLCAPSA